MDIHTISAEGNNTIHPTKGYPDVPLDLQSASIRLVSIYLDDSKQICGHLEAFEKSSFPPFMALSYEWGARDTTYCMLLNGRIHPILANVFHAIHAILEYRKNNDPNPKYPEDCLIDETGVTLQYIWIDSICIDQENIAERNHQVSLMKDIYSKASVVVAWLGLGNDSTTRMMQQFRKARGRYRWLRSQVISSRSLKTFFDLEYFHRMWIVQELVLARRFVVMCGREAIDGMAIRLYLNLQRPETARRLSQTAGGSVFSAGELNRDLSFLIQQFRGRKCMDARDRVYALLGIADENCVTNLPGNLASHAIHNLCVWYPGVSLCPAFFTRHDITADYHISPFELYLKLVKKNGIKFLLFTSRYTSPLIRIALGLFRDLIIPLDTSDYAPEELATLRTPQGVHWRPRPSHRALTSVINSSYVPPILFVRPLTNRLIYNSFSIKGKIASTEYLAYVRSLDWSKVDSWAANYAALRRYSKSRTSSFQIRLKDLETYAPMRLVEWAFATLGEEVDARLAEAIARMAGKERQWGPWRERGIVDIGNMIV